MDETRPAPGKTFRESGSVLRAIEMSPEARDAENWPEDTIDQMAVVVFGLDRERLRQLELVS